MASNKKDNKKERTFEKKVRPKKETILIEFTKELKKDWVGNNYNGKQVINLIKKYGKEYLVVDNTAIDNI